MKISARCWSVVGCLAAGLSGCADTASGEGDAITIGIFSALSDDRAFAEEINRAAAIAVDEINSAGGVRIDSRTYDLRLVIKDDAGDASRGRMVAQEFLDDDVRLAIGPSYSSTTLGDANDGVADFAIDNGMLIMSASATSPQITDLDDDDFVWRTCASDAFQGGISAQFIHEDLGIDNLGVIYRDDAWGTAFAGVLTERFEMLGGAVVHSVPYDESWDQNDNFAERLTVLFGDPRPDAIVVASFSEGTRLLNDIAAGGFIDASYHPAIFVPEIDIESMVINVEPSVHELMYGSSPGPDMTYEHYARFESEYESSVGTTASTWGAFAYDAVYVMAHAISKANSNDPDAVKNELRSVSGDGSDALVVGPLDYAEGLAALAEGKTIDYEGASGSVAFDENGDPGAGWYTVWQIKDGEGVLLDTIQVTK